MKTKTQLILAVALVGLAASCKNAKSEEMETADAIEMVADSAVAASSSEKKEVKSYSENRKFIRTADLKFEVKDVSKSTHAIENATRKFGGLVTLSNLENHILDTEKTKVSEENTLETTKYFVDNTITIRVPNSRLDTVVSIIEKEIAFINNRKIAQDDVSLQMLANQMAQLRNKNSAKRVANAIDTKGKNLGQIVDGEQNLQDKNEVADNSKMENLSLQDQVNFSTISLHIFQPENYRQAMLPNVKSTNAFRPNIGMQILDSIKTGWYILENILAFVVQLWSVFLLLFLAWFGYKKYKSRSNKALV